MGVLSVFRDKVITRKQAIKAVILGALTGLFGFLLFLMLFWFITGREDEDLLPVQKHEGEEVSFYATQFGKFSSFEGADQFKSQFPTLNKALILEVNNEFYVWSNVSLEQKKVETIPSSFNKAFYLSADGCESEAIAQLPTNLKNTEILKPDYNESANGVQLPKDYADFMQVTAKVSEDAEVIRLYVLQHYVEQNTCLKIRF